MGAALSSAPTNPSEIRSTDSASSSSSDPSASSNSSNSANRSMSSSDSKSLESENESSVQSPNSSPTDAKIEQDLEGSEKVLNNGEEGGEEGEEGGEEEEGECGFCLFMKGGGCKDSFIAWEQCIEQAENSEEDIVEKCFEVTAALKKCMEAHPDYYEPILRAEKSAEETAVKELEKEIEAVSKGSDQIASSKESEDQQASSKEPEQPAGSKDSEQPAASSHR